MMRFGFCDLAVIPVRTEPSDRAEMSTQFLFGDLLEILEHSGSWYYVRSYFDDYTGWIDSRQIKLINDDEYFRLGQADLSVNHQFHGDLVRVEGKSLRLPAACSFYDLKGRAMLVQDQQYVLEGKALPFKFNGMQNLIESAMGYLSCPYLWGGKTYLGLDCSGLTQVVYKQNGIKLLRDAAQQSTQGELISFLSDGLPGDLAFFDNEEGRIVHVGILLSNQNILHCSGKVRIDAIDHQGIYNRGKNQYTHKLRLIRRMISTP